MVRLFAVLTAIFVLSFSFAGCGIFGGGDGAGADQELEVLSWDDEGQPVEQVIEIEEQLIVIGFDGLVLEEVTYLYTQQVGLESLRRINRDLISLIEDSKGGDEPLGLDWVVSVHDYVRLADELFALYLGRPITDEQRADYGDVFLSGLETVQVMDYGADRLLAAALVIGPSGRSLDVMSEDEVQQFERLVREASFFLRDSSRLVELSIEEVGSAVGGVDLR